jgi:phosphoribosylformylglycinamidine cyclo-ligase
LSFDYKKSGVDVEAGDALVDWLANGSKASATEKSSTPHHARIVSGIGGFASLFRIGFPEMKKPCLVTCTDGVGTKVKLASHFEDFSTVGQDMVAMCVNDLICTGGDPLLFLDYYATGKLVLEHAKAFLTGVKKACSESDSALVGGETAEMPGVYQKHDFDCAGFAVGIVDEEKAWGPHRVKAGDILLGISSSGFHSNGYSLLRKVYEKDLEKNRELLLRPTALYVQVVKQLKSQLKSDLEIHAAAHITGGGVENIPRVLPDHLKMKLNSWQWPEEFLEVQRRTGMSDQQMLETLNCGVGFVLVLPAASVELATKIILQFDFRAVPVGQVVEENHK